MNALPLIAAASGQALIAGMILLIAVAFVVVVWAMASRYKKIPPNQVGTDVFDPSPSASGCIHRRAVQRRRAAGYASRIPAAAGDDDRGYRRRLSLPTGASALEG